ncbi:hypothetical protein ACHAPT_006381 [Fusarium lateritium]
MSALLAITPPPALLCSALIFFPPDPDRRIHFNSPISFDPKPAPRSSVQTLSLSLSVASDPDPRIRITPTTRCDSEPQLEPQPSILVLSSPALHVRPDPRRPLTPLTMDPNIPFEGIREWANSNILPVSRDVSFAHLKVSRHCLYDESVWATIMAGLWDADWGFCVGSSLDAGMAFLAHGNLCSALEVDDGPTFEFFCYSGWLKMLESYRVADGAGLASWDLGIDIAELLVVAFAIDAQMSAECAIALIATVQWVADVLPNHPIRVLTISSEDAPRALRKLLHLYNLGSPHQISLNPPNSIASARRQVQEIIQVSHTDLVPTFQRVSRGDLERQVVISWHKLPVFDLDEDRTVSRIRAIDEYVQDRLTLERNFTLVRLGELEARFLNDVNYYRAHNEATFDGCLIRFATPASRMPFPWMGSATSHREQVIYDAVTGQPTKVNLPVCQGERLEQVAWAVRTRNIPSRICIYTEASSVNEFVSAGSHHRRLRVCNEQVGGFIAAVSRRLAHWGVDGPSVLCCFFDSAIEKMAHLNTLDRLHVQGVLGDRASSIGLVGKHAAVFDKVLPLVGFDHRLALFVALPSGSALVRQVKVQLAALLAIGIHQLFTFDADVSGQNLIQECHGWSKPLASTGSMWLALGLWKGLALKYDDFATPKANQESQDGKLKVGEHGVFVDMGACHQIKNTITLLSNTIMAQEIAMLPISTSAESRELDLGERFELQKDLLQAYIFQLTALALNPTTLYDVSTGTRMSITHWIPSWTEPTVDLKQIYNADMSGCIFGIYHGMERAEGSGDVRLSDWTWIEDTVVAD